MLGFNHSVSSQYHDGSVLFDGVSYDGAEHFDDGLYSGAPGLIPAPTEVPLAVSEPMYGLYEQYVFTPLCCDVIESKFLSEDIGRGKLRGGPAFSEWHAEPTCPCDSPWIGDVLSSSGAVLCLMDHPSQILFGVATIWPMEVF